MSNRSAGVVAIVAIALSMLAGCASNVSQVRTRGALDIGCDPAEVDVRLVERSYLGSTRYEAEGCGATRTYECRARLYSLGLPLGERTCKQPGGSPDPVITSRGVAF
ncbi:hypothetical protein JM946_18205 [Steroidobacter sp. S1-65]|uniref:Lipoprotein n=1 Tax=Steroidobacter gossypii TaxID=2805490 RepID=A0ABS1X0C9_9GAMM|nr:hypothetical protein [Steroidobacter gossypii]MBM0106668.1 hypothetical protein [Steroidobacter gossypii]